jgi:TonB-dependent SusC/RagA subfamily outer membrane receptor
MILPILLIAIGLVSIKLNATERFANKVDALKAAVNQVISDTTKPVVSVKSLSISKIVKKDSGEQASSKMDMNQALIMVDGKKVSEEQMKKINPNDIVSVNVLKGEKAVTYGAAGSNGVILIQTKFGPPPPPPAPYIAPPPPPTTTYIAPPPPPVFGVTVVGTKDAIVNKSGKEPLYVIDGVPVKKNGINPVENINPNNIERIDVLKNKSAVSLYGKEGEDGVILITTKKGRSKVADTTQVKPAARKN